MAADGSVIIEITADDSKFEKTTSRLGTVASGAFQVVTAAIAAASTALIGLGTVAVKIGSDFEREMANLGAITGMATDEMQRMEEGIRGVALETGRSVIEIASNAKMLAEAGGDTNLVLEQLAHGTNLATATQTDMATTLDFLGSAMKTFGVEADDTQAVVDSFAAVTTLANVELAQLGEAYTNVGGAAANAGLGIDEVNAMLVVMSNAGLKGGAAGTSLNAVLRNLSTPTKNAAAALDELGIALYDSDGASRDMLVVMQELEGALGGLTAEQRNRYEAVIFDTVAQKGWNMLVADGIDSIIDLSGELANAGDAFDELGQAAGMAEKQTDTLQGGLSKLTAQAQDLGIEFYQSIQEPLKDVVKKATGYLDELSVAFSEGGFSGLVGALGGVLADVVTEIANAAPMMIDAAVCLLQALLTGLQANLPALAQGAVSIVTSLVNGIATLLPQLAVAAVQLLTALANGIAAALPTLIPAAVAALTALVQGLIDNIPALIDAALQLIRGLMDGLIAAVPVLLEAIPTIITSLVTALLESIPLIIQAGIDLLVSLVEALPDIITTIVAVLPQIISSIINALVSNIPLIIQAGIDLFVALIQNLPTIIVEIVKAVPQIIAGIVEGFISLAGEIVNVGKNIVTGIWDGIVGMATWIKDKVTGFFSGIVDGVKGFLGIHSPSTVFADIGGNTIEGYADGVDKGASANESRVLSTVEGLSSDMADSLGSGGADSGVALMNNLTKSATNGLQGVATVAAQSVETFNTTVTSKLGEVRQTATEVMKTLCDLVTAKQPEIVKVATNTVTSFCQTILSKHSEFYRVGVDAMNGLNEGLRIQGQVAIATARSIANAIIAEMQRALAIHSPSRKMRDLVGKPTAQGFMVGFEDEMENFHRLAQATVDRETGRLSANVAAQADGKAAAEGITKEVHTTNRTVEKVARVEGEGVTGELVRMLGLKIKAEDRRRGPELA